jgi:hypothetical protein
LTLKFIFSKTIDAFSEWTDDDDDDDDDDDNDNDNNRRRKLCELKNVIKQNELKIPELWNAATDLRPYNGDVLSIAATRYAFRSLYIRA